MPSRTLGTQKHYKTYLEKWILFCREREVNYCSPPISDVLEFLMGLYAQGLGYSTLDTTCYALSSLFVSLTVRILALIHWLSDS